MSTFGDNLRNLRNGRGLSQEELAKLLGTSKQVISRYENGQRSPKVTTVADYAEKLGVSISFFTSNPFDDLRRGLSASPEVSNMLREVRDSLPDYGAATDPGRDELLHIYDGLNRRGRDNLLNYARYLSGDPEMKQYGASSTTTA